MAWRRRWRCRRRFLPPGPARELTSLVHLGIQVAIEAGFTYPAEPRQLRVPREPLLRNLGLQPEALQPIIDRLPDAPQVAVFAGESGHGYKFCSVVGEILADLAIDGATRHDIGLFRIGRFAA